MSESVSAGASVPTQHTGGRPRDRSRDVALRGVVLELLAEVGYDRLTVEAVAARARAGKTTIYRRWPGKAELVVDALDGAKGVPELPDSGSLQQDLRALAEFVTSPEHRFGARLMIGMVNAASRDEELRAVFQRKFLNPRMASVRRVFERAVARGEMPPGHDLDLLARVFPALVFQQLVMTGELADPEFARQVMDEVVRPLATSQPLSPDDSGGRGTAARTPH